MAFRFLDLPAELRNRVYSMVIEENPKQALCFMRFPSICAVSLQVRREAVPVFFSDTNFVVYTASDFMIRANCEYASHEQFEASGQLHLSTRVANILMRFAAVAYIRHITFRVTFNHSQYVHIMREYGRPRKSELDLEIALKEKFQDWCKKQKEGKLRDVKQILIVTVSLDYEDKSLKVLAQPGKAYPDGLKTCAVAVDEAVEDVRERAEVFGDQEEFKGYTIKELETITRAWKYGFV